MFCGVLGAAGFGLAAMTILMATQMSAGHLRDITPGGPERVVSQTTAPSSASGTTTSSTYVVQTEQGAR